MTPRSARSRGPVVIDTGVFGSELVRRSAPIAEVYRPLVEGRPFIISFITLAEIRVGAHEADRWIAAPALWLSVPLVSHDKIFRNVDGVELLTKVGDVHR